MYIAALISFLACLTSFQIIKSPRLCSHPQIRIPRSLKDPRIPTDNSAFNYNGVRTRSNSKPYAPGDPTFYPAVENFAWPATKGSGCGNFLLSPDLTSASVYTSVGHRQVALHGSQDCQGPVVATQQTFDDQGWHCSGDFPYKSFFVTYHVPNA